MEEMAARQPFGCSHGLLSEGTQGQAGRKLEFHLCESVTYTVHGGDYSLAMGSCSEPSG